jgi:hypothetical protein
MTGEIDPNAPDQPERSLPSADLPLSTPREVSVDYQPSAADVPAGKTIHPRRPAPRVSEGPDVPDPTPSPPVEIDAP